jgi:hypothetical protein
MAADDIRKLEVIRQRAGGFEKLVETLRVRGGELARISKSTLYRWEKMEELPDRARAVIDQLYRFIDAERATLRIAHHKTPLALSTLLTYQSRRLLQTEQAGDELGSKAPLARLGFQGDPVITNNGTESLARLHEGEADLAVASADLLKTFRVNHPGTECRRLCRIASSYLDSVCNRRIHSHRHLHEVDFFGYPNGTSIKANIERTLMKLCREPSEFSVVPLNPHEAAEKTRKGNRKPDEFIIVRYDTFRDAAEAMWREAAEVQCLVGGASWIAGVRREYDNLKRAKQLIRPKRRRPRFYDVPGYLFGRFLFDAYVRPDRANPAAIRAFLIAINDVSIDIMNRKSYYRNSIFRNLYNLNSLIDEDSERDIKRFIASYQAHYRVSTIDLGTILSLWNGEKDETRHAGSAGPTAAE